MGIPGWAIPLGIALKAPDTIKDVFGLYTGIRDDNRKEADLSQAQFDLKQFEQNPDYQPDYAKYSDPKLAAQTGMILTGQRDLKNQREAAPVSKMLARFAADGNDADPNFTGAEWMKGMATTYPVDGKVMSPEEYDAAMSGSVMGGRKGSIPLSAFGANPVAAGLLQNAELAAQQKGTMARAFGGGKGASPLDFATVAMDKEKAIGLKDTMQGLHDQAGTQLAQTKYADELAAAKAKAEEDQQKINNLAQFQKDIAGVGGGYRAAQPINVDPGAPLPADADPRTGLVYKDINGNPTQNRLMPFAEARDLYLQAASDNKVDPSKAIDDLAKQYETTYTDAGGLPTDQNWMGKQMNMTKEMLYSAAGRGDVRAKAIRDKMQADELAQAEAKRMVLVNNPMPSKLSVNPVSPEHQSALDLAVAEKRLDPYKINSRNREDLARMAFNNPGIDLNAISAQLGVARNKDVIMKAGVAEMLPELIQKTAAAGKALNYSDVKFVGSVQKWKNGQLNDPKLTRYMTLRNDQLLTIGSVVRGNGMTDMAQKLEEEAMHPTLAPKALDQWVEGQLESIDPRLNFYRKLTKGNAAIPRSDYQPGSGAKGLVGGQGAAKVPADLQSKVDAELARRAKGGR